MYSTIVWQHLRDPQNRGVLKDPDGLGESKYPKCGDHLIVQLHVEEGRIRNARFLAKACAPVVAVASLATTRLVGNTIEEARKLSVLRLDKDIGGLPISKRHALWMFLEALFGALDQATHQAAKQSEMENE
ncbi:MAG: iron-sulfur cluster assembly scaffold protein [Candidatus Eremiobacteraeota bacterium]|nr:iron-sulfur cluster assembly scaffold protein [Candidatus Eremiobacteraeota bacterium]